MALTTLFGITAATGLIIATVALLFALAAFTRTMATHQIQMVPIDSGIDKENDDYMKQWATSTETFEEQTKLYQEDLEDNMPEFYVPKEEREIISY